MQRVKKVKFMKKFVEIYWWYQKSPLKVGRIIAFCYRIDWNFTVSHNSLFVVLILITGRTHKQFYFDFGFISASIGLWRPQPFLVLAPGRTHSSLISTSAWL